MTAGQDARFYRMFLPLQEMERHGHQVTWRSGGEDEDGVRAPITGADMAGHDIIIGQRFNHHTGLQVWRRARTPFSRLVYELDDDVFSIGPENWQAHHLYKQEEIRDAVTHSAQVADLVTVSTEHLAGVMRERTGNQDVAVLPNCIPGWVCDHQRPRRERLVAGWMGGASHGNDVGIIASPLRRFLKRFPGWDAEVKGTDFRPTIGHDRVSFSPWIHITDDPRAYYGSIDFDVGLAPLDDNEFSRSKSFIKALEYSALGIPVIASDVEPYRGFIRDGETGFLIRYEHEWLKRMSELAADEALREKMGLAARQAAQEHTIEQGWRKWEATYADLF